MKKKNLIAGIIILALMAFIYFVLNKPEPLPTVGENGNIQGSYSIKNIMALGENYECSFTKSDEAANVSGTLQTDGSKVRGDFDITIQTRGGESSSFASHLITRENTSYTWTSLQQVGYKTKIARSATRGASPAEQAQIIGQNDKIVMNCRPKVIDQSVFNVPEAINFTEV